MTDQRLIREGALQFLSVNASCLPEAECSGGSTVPDMSTTLKFSEDNKKLTIDLKLAVGLLNKEREVVANVDVTARCWFEFDRQLPVKDSQDYELCYPFVLAMYQRTAERAQREFELMGYFVQLPLMAFQQVAEITSVV